MKEAQVPVGESLQSIRATSLGAWAEAIHDIFVPLQIAPHRSGDFRGTVMSGHWAHLMASDVRSTGQTFDRTRTLVSSRPSDLLQVGLVAEGSARLEQDGRSCHLEAGDFALYETSRPFTWSLGADQWRLLVYTWPRQSITLADTETQRLTARCLDGRAGVARILSPMLTGLVGAAPDITEVNAARIADQVAELAITAAMEEAHEQVPDRTSPELVRKIVIHIEEHLGDPDLSPATIAHEFFISTRTLHRLFAAKGETVGSWIRQRRLEACRRDMLANHGTPRSLTEIATRFGFVDLAVFSRSFARQFGVSPSRYRQTH